MEFYYSARNNRKEIVKGIVQALNQNDALSLIEEKGYEVLSIGEKKQTFEVRMVFFERVKIKDLVAFYRALAMMISADVPIVQAMRMVAAQTQNGKLRTLLMEVYGNVNEGMKFSEALARHKDVFGEFYIHMIRSGEASGKFDEVLNDLADQQEKEYEFQSKIKGALTYPTFILSAMVIMGVAMFIFVIPRLMTMLSESGVALPLSTRILMGISNFANHNKFIIIPLIMVLPFVLRYAVKKTTFGKKIWGQLIMKIPRLGTQLVQKTYLVRLTKSLSTLLVGGVPLIEAITITADVVGNYHYERLLKETANAVKDGNTIGSVFSQHRELIPDMLAQMTMVGEQTGRIDQVFDKIGNFYAKEVDVQVENLSKMIEPVLMLLMGGGVGFLVISIMVPLFKASQAVG